jgi:hypothetical protein
MHILVLQKAQQKAIFVAIIRCTYALQPNLFIPVIIPMVDDSFPHVTQLLPRQQAQANTNNQSNSRAITMYEQIDAMKRRADGPRPGQPWPKCCNHGCENEPVTSNQRTVFCGWSGLSE